jgi:hypothetical protein
MLGWAKEEESDEEKRWNLAVHGAPKRDRGGRRAVTWIGPEGPRSRPWTWDRGSNFGNFKRKKWDKEWVPKNYGRWKDVVGKEAWPELAAAAEWLRPHLNNPKKQAMCDWLIRDLMGTENRTMAQAASDAGISKGYASKIVLQLALDIKF